MNRQAAERQEDTTEERESEVLNDVSMDADEPTEVELLEPAEEVERAEESPTGQEMDGLIANERTKACVTLTELGLRSEVWLNWKRAVLKTERKSYLEANDEKACVMLENKNYFHKNGKSRVYCCMLCFEDKSAKLIQCLKHCDGQGPANAHMTKWHSNLVVSRKKLKTSHTPGEVTVLGQGDTGGSVLSPITLDTGSTSGDKARPKTVLALAMESGKEKRKTTTERIKNNFQELVFDFANNCNLPVRSVCDKTLPEFRNLIRFAIQNASTLAPLKDKIFMGKEKYGRIMGIKISRMVAAVRLGVQEARRYNAQLAGQSVPFITVSFDIWDGKLSEFLGVSFHLTLAPPVNTVARIASGLIHAKGHDAKTVAEQVLENAGAYGIEQRDLYRAVNDTTNSAVKTGEILVGEKGTCAMHVVQLCMKHATGAARRTRNKEVTDEFDACAAHTKLTRQPIDWLMNKKAKKRYEEYVRVMGELRRGCVRFYLPNTVRVAGDHKFKSELLRGRYNLRHYSKDDAVALKFEEIKNEDFVKVAEFEAVLDPAARLSRVVQTDRGGSMSFTFIQVMETYAKYLCEKNWWVADVDITTNIGDCKQWHGNAKFPTRPVFGAPPKNATRAVDTVHLIKKKTSAMDPMAQKLIERMAQEISNYLLPPSENQLLAMACNPLTATLGMKKLNLLLTLIDTRVDTRDPKLEDVDFVKASKKALVEEIRKVCVANDPPSNNCNDGEASDSDDDDILRALRVSRDKASSEAAGTDRVVAEVEEFFDHKLKCGEVLKSQGVKASVVEQIGSSPSKWEENFFLIAENFDVIQWWADTGCKQYPSIYVVARLILAVPDSNGHQERTFSTSQWMDDPLRKAQSYATFEMKTLLYRNRSFLGLYEERVSAAMQAAASKVAGTLVKNARAHAKDVTASVESPAKVPAGQVHNEEEENDEDDEFAHDVDEELQAAVEDGYSDDSLLEELTKLDKT